MTKEEAIKELKDFKDKSWDGMPEEVIDIAIKSLEAWELVIEKLQKYRDLYPSNSTIFNTVSDCLLMVLAGLDGVE